MESASAAATVPARLELPPWRANLATIGALTARAKNELVRVPGAAIPGVLAPTIFFLGLNGVFGALTQLRGFTTGSYEAFIVPVSMLQGAGFTGAAAGVNLARDIERGWLDRLLVSPAPRWVLLAGTVLAASARALIPATFVLAIALLLGAGFPGVDGLLVAYLMVAAMAAVAACWGSFLALRFKSQSAAPLMQAGMMALILTTTAYAPLALLAGWLQHVARVNPVTKVVEAARQGFVGGVTWADTWPGLTGAGGDAGGPRRPRPARDAAHRPDERRPEPAPESALQLAERVLRWNWLEGERDGFRYPYTRPSPSRYPWQWYWDSCFAAIVWRRFDRERARIELESLLAAQRADGFVGHTIFWDGPVSLLRLAFYNVASRSALQTETIQPPLLAWAWRIAVGDPGEEPRIGAQVDWLAANRDLDGDGLLWIVQPDESGLDASPKFEPVWGRRSNGRIGFPLLVRHNRRLGFDARRVREPAARSSARCSSTRCGRSRCRRSAAPRRRRRLVERLWDERRGLFVDEAQPGGLRPAPLTWASLAPLALPDLPESIGRRLVEEHLLNRERVPDPGGAARRSPPASPATNPTAAAARSAATGAARPGSTPPGWSGWGCAASATSRRRSASPTA